MKKYCDCGNPQSKPPHTHSLESTADTLMKKAWKEVPHLIAYEGIVYEETITGKVFADARTGNQVLSADIIRARVIAHSVNSYAKMKYALRHADAFIDRVGQGGRVLELVQEALKQAEGQP